MTDLERLNILDRYCKRMDDQSEICRRVELCIETGALSVYLLITGTAAWRLLVAGLRLR